VKLMRLGERGRERPGVLRADGTVADVSNIVGDFGPQWFAEAGPAQLQDVDLDVLPTLDTESVRVGAAIARPGKVVCIGLNYADHAAESGADVPTEPILFMKDPACVVGANDDIRYPPTATKVDWEVELGVVIGRRASYLTESDDALAHVAGYCVVNDLSERAFQLERGGQWDKGKSCETFCPTGPWVVTSDEVADPQHLSLWLDVNDEPAQRGSTATMIFDVATIVRAISEFMVLEPGDLISTGTPPGVGMGQQPPRYLSPGDTLRLGITGLGEQFQRVVSAHGVEPD
jgi:2-keto-4-pentenoate hydratase/2-oxohepta-3-ene-1,7-dioic acid hydratase in catechol pathway